MSVEFLSNFYRTMNRDPSYDPDEEYRYECLRCGAITAADSHPGDCGDCGAGLRNRRMPYE